MCLMHERQEKGGRLEVKSRGSSNQSLVVSLRDLSDFIIFSPLSFLFLLFLMSLRRIAECHTTLLYTSLLHKTLPFPIFCNIFWIISKFRKTTTTTKCTKIISCITTFAIFYRLFYIIICFYHFNYTCISCVTMIYTKEN